MRVSIRGGDYSVIPKPLEDLAKRRDADHPEFANADVRHQKMQEARKFVDALPRQYEIEKALKAGAHESH